MPEGDKIGDGMLAKAVRGARYWCWGAGWRFLLEWVWVEGRGRGGRGFCWDAGVVEAGGGRGIEVWLGLVCWAGDGGKRMGRVRLEVMAGEGDLC